jgi:uncharacterized protein YeaO (DUF488 family)
MEWSGGDVAVTFKRAYEKPSPKDGYRVLVDGLWPRGLAKEKLKVADWLRDIAPSPELRAWYGHKPEKWEEFRKRYRAELSRPPRKAILEDLVERARKGNVTLVFAARDAERANATVIAEMVRELM